jgi:hypothetical protein
MVVPQTTHGAVIRMLGRAKEDVVMKSSVAVGENGCGTVRNPERE